jgi:hypothetical protein
MIDRVTRRLSGEQGPLLAALLAMAISLPALRLGFQADDHVLAFMLERGDTAAWSLFHASKEMMAEGRQIGAMAWWSSPLMHGEFLRPLSSLSIAVQLWMTPHTPWLMLLVNVLVYGACVWIASRVYRRLIPVVSTAALASLMFAIDDAHAHSVGWISGRNTILALLGSIATLFLHIRATDTGQRRLTTASVIAVILTLATGEAGTWAYIYLIAHALTLDHRPVAVRIQALAPHALVGAIWAAIYVHGHYGFHHTSWYYELSSPGAALEHGFLNLPLSLTSLLGPSLIGLSLFEPLWKSRLALLPVVLGLLWLLWPSARASKETRFFALVTALGVLPAFLTVPQDRVLIGAGFGAFGWIANAIADAESKSGLRHRAVRVLLRTCHVWLAGLLFVPMLAAQYRFELGANALRALVKPDRVVVLLNTPVELLSNYVAGKIDREHGERPRAIHQLYAGGSELIIHRIDPRTLEITVPRGWGYVPLERIFCAPEELPRPGDERSVVGMTVRTLESTADGLPKRARFTFEAPLESDAFEWLVWTDAGHPVPWQPPGVGEQARLAPLNLIKALPQ